MNEHECLGARAIYTFVWCISFIFSLWLLLLFLSLFDEWRWMTRSRTYIFFFSFVFFYFVFCCRCHDKYEKKKCTSVFWVLDISICVYSFATHSLDEEDYDYDQPNSIWPNSDKMEFFARSKLYLSCNTYSRFDDSKPNRQLIANEREFPIESKYLGRSDTYRYRERLTS